MSRKDSKIKLVKQVDIEGILIIEGGQSFEDERGFFRESWKRNEFEEALGKSWMHVQENHAYSKKSVLRGIHIAPWDKLIYVPFGRVFIALVDLRKDSLTFGKYVSMEIGDNNRVKIFMPAGIGNSYLILSDEAVYEYQVNKYFEPGHEIGVMWNDSEIGIEWPIEEPLLSEKDQQNLSLKEYKDSLS